MPRVWDIDNFDFKPPSNAWLKSFPPGTAFSVELKFEAHKTFRVLINGKTSSAGSGTITEG